MGLQKNLQSVEFVNCRLLGATKIHPMNVLTISLDEHMDLLLGMKHLRSVTIDRCLKLTKACIEPLAKINTLQSLSLRRIPAVVDNIALLQSNISSSFDTN